MNKTLRLSLSVTLTTFAVAGGCSEGEEKGGLSDPPPNSNAGTTSTGPNVTVDAGDMDAFEPPPTGEAGAGSVPDPSTLMCDGLEELGDCGTTTVEAQIEPINLLLVIDKSGS